MYVANRNIYKTARKMAGFTQERAAEALGISVESIRAYETGSRRPPEMVVSDMCIAYNSQLLGIQHLRLASDNLGASIPEVESLPLAEAAMRLIGAVYGFVDRQRDRGLIRIAQDGRVDELERPELDEIMDELRELARAAMQLQYAQERED